MDDFDIDNINNSIDNFKNVELMIKKVILKCGKENLIDNTMIDVSNSYVFGVKNADIVQHFLVDDVHVYQFLNGRQSIDFFVSLQPIFEKNASNGYSFFKYNNVPCFEYSLGGVGNGLDIGLNNDGSAKYIMDRHISVLCSSNGRITNQVVASSGNKLSIYPFTDVSYYFLSGNAKAHCDNGNLFEFLGESDLIKSDILMLSNLKNKLENFNFSKAQNQEKKGLLKKLLGKNRELDEKIDIFSRKDGRVL